MLGENSVRMQGISRVFNHVRGRCVLGYKLLLRASFDPTAQYVLSNTTSILNFLYANLYQDEKE